MIDLIPQGIALAMSLASIMLDFLGEAGLDIHVTLLSIGFLALALAGLQKGEARRIRWPRRVSGRATVGMPGGALKVCRLAGGHGRMEAVAVSADRAELATSPGTTQSKGATQCIQ